MLLAPQDPARVVEFGLCDVFRGFGVEAGPGLNLKGRDLYFETWRELVSGQIATSIGFSHSKKCLIGGFLSLEIFFWFPLLIALSVLLPFNDQHMCIADPTFS